MVFRSNSVARISFDAGQRLVIISRRRSRRCRFEIRVGVGFVSSSTWVAVYENVNATVPTPLNMIAGGLDLISDG